MPSENSPILGYSSAAPTKVIQYLLKRGSVYKPYDIITIVLYYWRFAQGAGIDPLMILAQSVHETTGQVSDGRWLPFSSWWAQRPRRNPAGIGCSGATSSVAKDPKKWAYKEDTGLWYKGYSFPSWDVATRVHIGLVLGYATVQPLPQQKMLIDFAASYDVACPRRYQGTCSTWKDLNGKWAVPGETYAQAIAALTTRLSA